MAKRILLFLSGVYLLLTVGVHFLALDRLFPMAPVRYKLTSEYVQLTASDGVKIIGRHWANPGAKFTLLYLHGNFEDLGRVGEYVPAFLRAGYAVFSMDYRNYGQSGGKPTEMNTCADVRLAYEYMRKQLGVPADRIIIWGYSVGSGPAVELALHQPAAGIVLQGAFVSVYRTMTGIPLFLGDKFVNLNKVPQLSMPVFLIHGMDDTTVPLWHAQALYAATNARKASLFIPGGQHGGLADYAGSVYWEELKKFTDSL